VKLLTNTLCREVGAPNCPGLLTASMFASKMRCSHLNWCIAKLHAMREISAWPRWRDARYSTFETVNNSTSGTDLTSALVHPSQRLAVLSVHHSENLILTSILDLDSDKGERLSLTAVACCDLHSIEVRLIVRWYSYNCFTASK
jgi:hypothetical protein